MGGTLPATVRAVTRSADSGRHSVGLLYAVNTIGAVVGALATTFVLIELLGIRQTIWLACLLNLLVAVAARSLARQRGMLEPPAPAAEAVAEPAPAETPRPLFHLVLAASAVVGFVFFLMELVWYRMMGPILGGSTYTFGVILGVALLGIGAGGLLYGRDRREPTAHRAALRRHLRPRGAVASPCPSPWATGSPLPPTSCAASRPRDSPRWWSAGRWSPCFVVLPAAVVAGYQFPVLVALLGAGRRRVARQVGPGLRLEHRRRDRRLDRRWLRAAAGALGADQLAAVDLAAAGAGGGLPARRRPPRGLAAASGCRRPSPCWRSRCRWPAGPSAFWRHSGIGAGRLAATPKSPNELRDVVAARRRAVQWEADGRESSVALSTGQRLLVSGQRQVRRQRPRRRADPGDERPGGRDPASRTRAARWSSAWAPAAAPAGWRRSTASRASTWSSSSRRSGGSPRTARRSTGASWRWTEVNLVIADGREYLLTTDRRVGPDLLRALEPVSRRHRQPVHPRVLPGGRGRSRRGRHLHAVAAGLRGGRPGGAHRLRDPGVRLSARRDLAGPVQGPPAGGVPRDRSSTISGGSPSGWRRSRSAPPCSPSGACREWPASTAAMSPTRTSPPPSARSRPTGSTPTTGRSSSSGSPARWGAGAGSTSLSCASWRSCAGRAGR